MAEDKNAQKSVEGVDDKANGGGQPKEGPHAKDHLTDPEKTPGTGALPTRGTNDTDPGSD